MPDPDDGNQKTIWPANQVVCLGSHPDLATTPRLKILLRDQISPS
jgi:hypothetical protein